MTAAKEITFPSCADCKSSIAFGGTYCRSCAQKRRYAATPATPSQPKKKTKKQKYKIKHCMQPKETRHFECSGLFVETEPGQTTCLHCRRKNEAKEDVGYATD